MIDLRNGDCLEILKTIPDNSVDSVVTDPPYGLSFMGKKWDYDVPSLAIFKEILRVLKPGGHMLCACGTRTQHRMAVNIEDAGFEIRDVITWLYGSGFPKSMDISKAIDKQAGAEREVVGEISKTQSYGHEGNNCFGSDVDRDGKMKITAPATDSAKQWQGWGTALKPACEFWTLARKPLSEKTVAANVLKHGTGGINIDGCRVETDEKLSISKSDPNSKGLTLSGGKIKAIDRSQHCMGRWPANLILDEEAAEVLDEQSGISPRKDLREDCKSSTGMFFEESKKLSRPKDFGGGASRFFYVAKASKNERNQGCESLETKTLARSCSANAGNEHEGSGFNQIHEMKNNHPTVKPIKLMTYLCRLITPPNGIVLDPFMGSGSTGVAAVKEGFGFIGIEREASYFEICKARIEGQSCANSVRGPALINFPNGK